MKSDPRRILLVMSTATYRAEAFLSAARRLGLPVVVGSERRQALAAANPDAHLVLDLADPSAAVRQAREFAGRVPLRAVIGTDDSSERLQQGRLARAVSTDYTNDLSRSGVEAHAPQCPEAATRSTRPPTTQDTWEQRANEGLAESHLRVVIADRVFAFLGWEGL